MLPVFFYVLDMNIELLVVNIYLSQFWISLVCPLASE